MDELTRKFFGRLFHMKRRSCAALAVGIAGFGWATPHQELIGMAALLSLLAAWSTLGWAAADRTGPVMRPVLAAPAARRAWLSAYLMAAPLVAALSCFACLLPNGIRPALGSAVLAAAYGWMIAAIGFCILLIADRPREAVWITGIVLALTVYTAAPEGTPLLGISSGWYPFALFKLELRQALASSGSPFTLKGIAYGRFVGVLPLLIVALLAWRWSLRSLDRAEVLPPEV